MKKSPRSKKSARAAKKSPRSKKSARAVPAKKKESAIGQLEEVIVKKVVDQLKPQLVEHIKELKKDLKSDIIEISNKPQVAALSQPNPAVPTPPAISGEAISGILDQLKSGGDIDIGKISSLLGQAGSAQPAGPPLDMEKLTPGQIEYMKMQNQQKMITTILPLFLQSQGGAGSGVLAEMMNRIFLEKINSSIFMDKIMIQKMAQSIAPGIQVPQTGLTTPISNQLSNPQPEGSEKTAI